MQWTSKDQRQARPYTSKLLDMAEDTYIDWKTLAQDLLGWMSEDDVKEFARSNDYIQEDPSVEDYDEDEDDDYEWEEHPDAVDQHDIEYDR